MRGDATSKNIKMRITQEGRARTKSGSHQPKKKKKEERGGKERGSHKNPSIGEKIEGKHVQGEGKVYGGG